MNVLRSITSYIDVIKENYSIYEYQRKALGLLYDYCKYYETDICIDEIDTCFFDEFLIYWLPKNQSRLEEKEIYQILRGIHDYCNYIKNIYDIPNLRQYEIIDAYAQECLRIYHLRRLFLEYLDDPIISISPFVIDLRAYKKHKEQKSTIKKQAVYDKGLFEVLDISFDSSIIIRKLSNGKHIRTNMDSSILAFMRKGDILNLTIRRREFFPYWEVDELRHCYLSKAHQYLTN